MKIALALSGLPRLYPIAAASWGRIMGKYSPDVYIHTWSSDNADFDANTVHQLNWTFEPCAFKIDALPEIDTTMYPDRHWPCIDVYRSISMWHGIQRAHQLIKESGTEYDLIIRGRLDWYVRDLILMAYDGIVIPYDSDKIPLIFQYAGSSIHGINDHFAYGSSINMDRYVQTINEIPILYQQEGVDYCPENFLAASLIKQDVPVMLQHMEHKLIRG